MDSMPATAFCSITESERRGETFVTRKITLAASRIKFGLQNTLYLGNLSAKRDWGYAPEYCEGMWRMLQQDKPKDYVLATGETHSVEEFCSLAFNHIGMPLTFQGVDENRVGLDNDGKVRVAVDKNYFRPTEVDLLIGDPSLAHKELGWKATTRFENLVFRTVEFDLRLATKEAESR